MICQYLYIRTCVAEACIKGREKELHPTDSVGCNYLSLPLMPTSGTQVPLQWHYNGHDGVSNHQHHDCLLNHLSKRRSKKTSKLCITGLCEGNSPVTGEFPTQRASNTENVSIWWRHHAHIFIAPSEWLSFSACDTHHLCDLPIMLH